jgi:hypothetical protein
MYKISKTGQICYKLSNPFQHKNVEYVEVLVPLGFTSKKGNLGSVQTVKRTSLVAL